jgi:hypothetical protein
VSVRLRGFFKFHSKQSYAYLLPVGTEFQLQRTGTANYTKSTTRGSSKLSRFLHRSPAALFVFLSFLCMCVSPTDRRVGGWCAVRVPRGINTTFDWTKQGERSGERTRTLYADTHTTDGATDQQSRRERDRLQSADARNTTRIWLVATCQLPLI